MSFYANLYYSHHGTNLSGLFVKKDLTMEVGNMRVLTDTQAQVIVRS